MPRMHHPRGIALALAVVSTSAPAQAPHPFGVDDMLAAERLSELDASPDGQWVAFTLRTTDREANKGRTDVWIVRPDGSELRQLTTDPANDSSPRWSADGRELLFLSTRGGSAQVWKIALGGGEPQQVTSFPVDVGGFEPFPDGKRLVFSAEVWPAAATLAESAAKDAAAQKDPVQAKVYDALLFRHWDSWEDGKRSHLFVCELGGGEPVDLMRGLDWDAPAPPFGGMEALSIHPDGSRVVFSAKAKAADEAWSTNLDLWEVPSDGTAPPRCLTDDNEALDDLPRFSPDGTKLAWVAMARPGYEADQQRIQVRDLASGATRTVAPDWDRSVAAFAWLPDGSGFLAEADDLGRHNLFAISASAANAAQSVRALTSAGYNTGAITSPAWGGRVLFLHDDYGAPAEIHSVGAEPSGGSGLATVTAINAALVASYQAGAYEQFTFQGAHGDGVYAWLVKPAGFDPAVRWPLVLLIHGGPQGSFGDHFHYRWNPQAFAGAGYAALMVDFHGSTGYGQAFCDAIRGDWGGAPYEDLMKGLDAALARYPWLDGERVAAAGGSYGGYMVNWIAGQTSRFKALVSHAGNLDERMAYFDTEELWFPEWDHEGTPWTNPEGYAEHNPIEHVAQWQTPILVIHGAKDYRVVDTQGMSTFTAAQRRGVPSRLLYFPDENHWILKPKNSALWYATVIEWLDRWCKAAQ
jgi:dipeptidyl aminopeptidase/acylaminoacyl peptidase